MVNHLEVQPPRVTRPVDDDRWLVAVTTVTPRPRVHWVTVDGAGHPTATGQRAVPPSVAARFRTTLRVTRGTLVCLDACGDALSPGVRSFVAGVHGL